MRKRTLLWLAVVLGFIMAGIFRDEVAVVLNKGINVCLECVGIG